MTEPPDVPPTAEAPPPADVPPPEEPYRCPRCGAPHDPYQEYCLECGARLARYGPRSRSVWRREAWTRESGFWFWATFLALLLVALIAGAIVLAATRDDNEPTRRQARRPTTSLLQPVTGITTPTLGETATVPGEGATAPPGDGEGNTSTTTTSTVQTVTTSTTGSLRTTGTTSTSTGATTGAIRSWPVGKAGYTVVLASVPTSRGRAAADAKAREAIGKGVDEVGVLNSSDYGSLRRGYYVVFSGVHETLAEATSALTDVRANGYPLAYRREIRP